MRVLWLVAVSASAGCGRLSFDPRDDASSNGTNDGAFDASTECLDPNLLGCWNFDNDTLDGTPNHNDAVSTGATFVAGHRGTAVVSNAGVAHLIAQSSSLQVSARATVEAWIRMDTLPASGDASYVFDNDNEYGLMLTSSGTLQGDFIATGGGIAALGVTPLPLGEWHHVAMRYDINGNFDLVLDGVVDGGVPANGQNTRTGTMGSRIGGDAGPVQFPPFDGAIDDVRVWGVVRAVSDL